ncbi:MAG: ABC transporter ATP-binding protein [Limnochordales bacterium]
MPAVTLEHVCKRFGDVVAADDVTLAIEEGEFFALLGPSGSGKTTVLRLIAGFLKPDSGRITIGGQAVDAVPPYQRDIGMVFQSYALFPHMTVYGNLAFGLSVRGVPKAEIRRRVQEMLELVRLPGMENRRPHQLSGGQQQRVALARALITNPKVVLLDEPLAALDKRLREAMQVELKQIQRQVGITAIFVTHDQEEALTLADRIAIMNQGQVEQVGTPADVYERPRTAFVAGFLGDANFFAGRVTAAGGGGRPGEVATEYGLVVRTAHPPPPVGQPATLIVRPERMRLVALADPDGGRPGAAEEPPGAGQRAGDPAGAGEPAGNGFAARVQQVIYSGKTIKYVVAAFGHEFQVMEQNRDDRPLAAGDPVWVAWSPSHTVVVQP